MRQNQIVANIKSAYSFIEVTYPLFEHIKQVRNQSQMDKVSGDFKSIVKKQRKLLAKKFHPDICNDEEKMKMINSACDFLLSINFAYEPPVQQQIFYCYTSNDLYGGSTTTSTYV